RPRRPRVGRDPRRRGRRPESPGHRARARGPAVGPGPLTPGPGRYPGENAMSITLRALDTATDLSRLAERDSLVTPRPVPVASVEEVGGRGPEGEFRSRVVAGDEAGRMVGFGGAGRGPWDRPGPFRVRIIVDPAMRRRGVGAILYDNLCEFTARQEACMLVGEGREDCPDGLPFAEQRGFRIERHLFGSTLQVAAFDESRFAGTVEALQAAGIRFFTFADLEGTLEDQRALYELNTVTGRDVPGSEMDGVQPFEQFQKDVFD